MGEFHVKTVRKKQVTENTCCMLPFISHSKADKAIHVYEIHRYVHR